jgi:hypothetical protein
MSSMQHILVVYGRVVLFGSAVGSVKNIGLVWFGSANTRGEGFFFKRVF